MTRWQAYSGALEAAGAEGYVNERTVTRPMAEVERRREEAEARMKAWMSQMELGDESQAFVDVLFRDASGRTEPPSDSS